MNRLNIIGTKVKPTRLIYNSTLRPLSLKPNFSKYKLKEQPPGFVVGTVNEASPSPPPDHYHGGYHWSYERLLAGTLVPLTIAPFILGTEIPILDTTFAVTCLFHSHMGLKSCIIDYIPQRVYGIWHTYASRLLTLGTSVALYGIYVVETTHNGIFEIIKSLWAA